MSVCLRFPPLHVQVRSKQQLAGALIGWGIPEDRAEYYESGIKEGGTVLGVTPRSVEDADYFETEWRDKYRGEHIYR